jgi:hypothetical protein
MSDEKKNLEMPQEFMRLVSDYNPSNLNLMSAEDVAYLFKHTANLSRAVHDLLEALRQGSAPDAYGIEFLEESLEKFKNWK